LPANAVTRRQLHHARGHDPVGFLAAVNFFVSPRSYWVVWIAIGWGIGLLLHGLRTFDKIPFLNGEWERQQVEKQLGRKL
jgi:hypothetical protein